MLNFGQSCCSGLSTWANEPDELFDFALDEIYDKSISLLPGALTEQLTGVDFSFPERSITLSRSGCYDLLRKVC